MNYECEFMKHHSILSLDQFVKLNEDRTSINEKLTNRVIKKKELLTQIIVELNLLRSCKFKVQSLVEKADIIDIHILFLLCNRIIELFDHMHVLFTIEKDLLTDYINFCIENVGEDFNAMMFKANRFEMLVDAVLCTTDGQDIWMRLLELHIRLDCYDKLSYVFQKGVRSLKEDSLPLWIMMLDHIQNRRPDMAETLFEEGSHISYNNISLEIRPKYLQWCVEFKGMNATRKLFNELKYLKPACCKLYSIMISIECIIPNIKVDIVRKLYDEVCTLFGRDNIDVWIDYIRFEHTHGLQKSMEKICTKALWTLKPNLRDTMADEFNKLKNELNKNLDQEVIVIDDD